MKQIFLQSFLGLFFSIMKNRILILTQYKEPDSRKVSVLTTTTTKTWVKDLVELTRILISWRLQISSLCLKILSKICPSRI